MTAYYLLTLLNLLSVVVAQEAPAFTIPTFTNDTSLRVRQDLCQRANAYNRGEMELRLALDSMALNLLFSQDEYTLLDDDGKLDEDYAGFFPEIVDELAKRAGFTWRQSFAINSGLPPNSNRDYTDLLLWGVEYFDVYVSWFEETIDRLKVGVNFPEGTIDTSYILVGIEIDTDDQKQSIDLLKWLEPFDDEVWYLIIFTIIISGVLYQVLDYIPPKHVNRHDQRRHKTPTYNEYKRQQKQRDSIATTNTTATTTMKEKLHEGVDAIGDGIFLSSLLFTQHFQFIPRTASSRLLSFSMALWALIITANYTANLASYFVIQNTPTPMIQSIEEAIQAEKYICVWKGTAAHRYLLKQYPQATLIVETNSELDFFQAVRKQECVLGLIYKSSLDYMEILREANPDCNLQWIGRTLQHSKGAFGVKADVGDLCSGLVNDVLNLHLKEMEADGYIDDAWDVALKKSANQDCKKEASDNDLDDGSTDAGYGRSVDEMAGTFVLHAIFALAAIVVYIISRLYDKCRHMSDESRQDFLQTMRVSTMPKEAPVAREEESTNGHAMDGPLSHSFHPTLRMEERMETFCQRQDELERTVKEEMKEMKEQMNTILHLLKEHSNQVDQKSFDA